jgi:hypothetical protein
MEKVGSGLDLQAHVLSRAMAVAMAMLFLPSISCIRSVRSCGLTDEAQLEYLASSWVLPVHGTSRVAH